MLALCLWCGDDGRMGWDGGVAIDGRADAVWRVSHEKERGGVVRESGGASPVFLCS